MDRRFEPSVPQMIDIPPSHSPAGRETFRATCSIFMEKTLWKGSRWTGEVSDGKNFPQKRFESKICR